MKLNELKFEWYGREDVTRRIIEYTKFREVSFLTKKGDVTTDAIRYKTCWKENFFLTLLEEYCLKENTNIYISVGKLMFPFTKETFRDKLNGYDLIFDFDGKVTKVKGQEHIDIESARNDTLKLVDELRACQIPYSVIFTGRKGFQIRVFSKNIPQIYPVAQRDKLFSKLGKSIKKKLKLKTLDEAQYLITQLIKLPLSYCSGYICKPLSYLELMNFDKELYHIRKMIEQPLSYMYEVNTGSDVGTHTRFEQFYKKYVK